MSINKVKERERGEKGKRTRDTVYRKFERKEESNFISESSEKVGNHDCW